MRCPQSVIVFHALAGALVSNLAAIAESSSSHARLLLGSAAQEDNVMAKRRIDNFDEDIDGDSQDKADLYEDAKQSGARITAESGIDDAMGSHLGWAGASATSKAPVSSLLQAEAPTQSESMTYVLKTLQKFQAFASQSRTGVEERHKAEEERLQAALESTKDVGTLLALNQSVTSNVQSLLETRRVYNNMINFASSMQKFLSAASSKGHGCSQTKCGPHAACTDTTLGAQCVCNEGYVGTGQDCSPPPEFMPHHLLFEGSSGAQQTKATGMNVAIFGKNNVAVAFSDLSRGGMGRTVVGNVREAGMAIMAPPETFTIDQGKAYDPVVAGTESRRVFFAWRDQNTGGLCWMRAAALGATKIRGADQHLTWGKPVNFCRSQAHKMVAIPMPNNRVIVLFADKVKATQHTPEEKFGNSVLLEIGDGGSITELGKFRFADNAVCRLEATKLTPKTFVIAARGAQAVDEMDSSVTTNQEASALFGEMSGDDLVFDPNPLNLEPKTKNIWARGVSLIAPNTFAYSYQQGTSLKMMMAIVHVNSTTHRMEVVHKPSAVRDGFSPFVSMLSVPYTAADPHTLTYYQSDTNNMVNVCAWDSARKSLSKCEDFVWLQGKVNSVSGVHLGGGKSFMVFSSEAGVPYYGVFGLSKK